MNARLNIEIGVHSKRVKDEPFAPWETTTAPFQLQTDLDTYAEYTSTLADTVWDYLEQQRADGWQNDVNVSVRLNNETHVPTAAGVLPLAKGHRDASLTGLEATSAQVIREFVNSIVIDLRQGAKY